MIMKRFYSLLNLDKSQIIKVNMSEGGHYLIESIGADLEAAKKGITWLLTQNYHLGYIAVMSKGSFKTAEIYKNVLGQEIVKLLLKNNEIELWGKNICLLYRPHNMYFDNKAPIVVFYPNKKFLDEIDSKNPNNILVVQWSENEMDYWKEKQNAIVI